MKSGLGRRLDGERFERQRGLVGDFARYVGKVCLFVWLVEFAARVKKKKKITAERMMFFWTHTSYMNLDFSQRHGKFHKRRILLRYD